ncbi:IPTL-CTERM sorting domain-containing protein [Parahaliea mediterranea]|uniref:IPTL-CTERM sorting domain-containing protein n=1 Tax=Parahaliea mediterranea TaxID=651086 RepID=A0A939INV7_9GAMM|nr:IPTL-CTERM sorting domain-containing protein [Parahaliea mediterranea]MBN7798945.1 IPTL-CTERM sorting domain-containing protein [Parahaliea mediterranea]
MGRKISSFRGVLLGLLCCAASIGAYAQHASFYEQSFETIEFPPPGWARLSVVGDEQWTRDTSEARFGQASAFIRYDYPEGSDWLISPAFTVSAGDELSFYIRTEFSGYAPDELSVRVSRTGTQPADFVDEILNLQEGVNYPASDTWENHTLSLGAYDGETIHIAFHNTNGDGNGVYIDQVALGTRPQVDVGVFSIEAPEIMGEGAVEPRVVVYNGGLQDQPFTVRLEADGGYSSTRLVSSLALLEMETVTFDSWTPEPGTRTLTATVELAGDEIPANNTLAKSINVVSEFPNQGWVTKDPLPGAKWASAVAGFAAPGADHNNRLMVLAGKDASSNMVSDVLVYDPHAGSWSSLASAPQAVQQGQAFFAGEKVFLIGGYASGFNPLSGGNVQIYDIATDSWSTGTDMPVAVGDFAAAQYRDSLLYVIGGYNGSVDVNNVQVYDTETDQWHAATPFPGNLVAGARAGIALGKLVVVGGYSQTSGSQTKQAYVGEIGADFTSITWSQVQDYPGGSIGRHAGVSLSRAWSPYVYYTGGDPTGQGNSAIAETWAFNVETMAWEAGPPKPTVASNLMGWGTVEVDDVVYLATVGGYDGSNFLATSEWLALGPVAPPTTELSVVPAGEVHPIAGSISGGGVACGIGHAASVTPEAVSSAPPADVSFPYDMLEMNLQNCINGATVTVELRFPEDLPADAEYWKYGLLPGTQSAESGWYSIPLTINGSIATFELVDGGQGDNDGTANGFIQDPGGIGVASTNSGPGTGTGTGNSPVGIPAVSHWALMLMSLLLAGFGLRRLRH